MTTKKKRVSRKKTIRFDYIKSNCFRVIRVDGAHGSLNPQADGIQLLSSVSATEYLRGKNIA